MLLYKPVLYICSSILFYAHSAAFILNMLVLGLADSYYITD